MEVLEDMAATMVCSTGLHEKYCPLLQLVLWWLLNIWTKIQQAPFSLIPVIQRLIQSHLLVVFCNDSTYCFTGQLYYGDNEHGNAVVRRGLGGRGGGALKITTRHCLIDGRITANGESIDGVHNSQAGKNLMICYFQENRTCVRKLICPFSLVTVQ